MSLGISPGLVAFTLEAPQSVPNIGEGDTFEDRWCKIEDTGTEAAAPYCGCGADIELLEYIFVTGAKE